jgi:Tol biopolymer transport system component
MEPQAANAGLWALLIMVTACGCVARAPRIPVSPCSSSQIVFDSDRSGQSEVYILDLVSQRVTPVTSHEQVGAGSRLPDFAPDGLHIVFVSANNVGEGYLFVIGTNGEGLRQLTTEEANYENPAWSPSGEWIAFEKGHAGVWGLYQIRPDGSDLRQIGPEEVSLFHPSWSPDERNLAVVTGTEEAWCAGILNIRTNAVEYVTEPGIAIGSVKWSPDGSTLVLDAVADSNHDLYALDLHTRELRRLTQHPAVDARPEWSPDGEQLVFHSTRDRGGSMAGEERWEEFELYLLDLPSGRITRLTDNAWFDAHPDWCTPRAHQPR